MKRSICFPLTSKSTNIFVLNCFGLFWLVKLCLICAFLFSPDLDEITFSLDKTILCMFLTNMQLFISQDINWWTSVVWITCGLLWCFYQLFGLSFWRHPFTAEDPLVRKWCNATFLQICSHEETNPTSWKDLIFSKFSFLGQLFL